MNDSRDGEIFSYTRSWVEIEELLQEAEQEQNKHYMRMQRGEKSSRLYHMRNYKALQGVVNSLRWVLGDLKMTRKVVLGRDD